MRVERAHNQYAPLPPSAPAWAIRFRMAWLNDDQRGMADARVTALVEAPRPRTRGPQALAEISKRRA